MWPTIQHEKLITQNVTNIIFIFETPPNTKPKEKEVGGTWHIMSPSSEKVGGHVIRVPHQIAPMHTTSLLHRRSQERAVRTKFLTCFVVSYFEMRCPKPNTALRLSSKHLLTPILGWLHHQPICSGSTIKNSPRIYGHRVKSQWILTFSY